MEIEGFNYADQVRGVLTLVADFGALSKQQLHIRKIKAENIWIDETFLKSLIEQSGTKSSESDASGSDAIRSVVIDELLLTLEDLHYGEYRIDRLSLEGKHIAYDMQQRIDGVFVIALASNVADLNGTVAFDASRYRADLTLRSKSAWLDAQLAKQEMHVSPAPDIRLKAEGDFEHVAFDLQIGAFGVARPPYLVTDATISLTGDYAVVPQRLRSNGYMKAKSNVADLNATFGAQMRFDDLNDTLRYRLTADIRGLKPEFAKIMGDANLTFAEMSDIRLHSVGDLRNVDANMTLKGGEVVYRNYRFRPETLRLHSSYRLDNSQLLAQGNGSVTGNVADMNLTFDTSARLDDLNRTLRLTLKSDLQLQYDFAADLLRERNITLTQLPGIHLQADTDPKTRRISADLSVDPAKLRYEEIPVATKRIVSHYLFDPATQQLESSLRASLLSVIADLDTDANLSLDLQDINRTLRYRAKAALRQKRPFMDLNLTQLGKIAMDAEGSMGALRADLRSSRLKAHVSSSDMERFDLALETQKVALDRLYLALPPKFKKSFAALEAKGYYRLTGPEADLTLRLKSARIAGRTLRTSPFRFRMKGEDFSLSPLKVTAKGVALRLSAQRRGGELTATLDGRAVHANLRFREKPLYGQGKVVISDIGKLLYEIDRLYPLGTIPKIAGPLTLRLTTPSHERLKVTLTSPKIALEGGRLEHLKAVAYYRPTRIDIPIFRFDMKGFKPKKMNRKIRLAHPAYVVMEDNKMEIDFVLRHLLSFKAQKRGDLLTGKLRTKKLYLAWPGYGQTKLTAAIDLYKSGPQTAVSGDVTLEETEITYESRVLDVSQDPDIIIVKKRKKRRQVDDSFLKNFFLDLRIRSRDEITYKVEAGTIMLKPDIEVRKDFGSTVRLLGKIRILEGEYDWGDKRFKLKEGAIAFRGLEEINPHLDLHVEYDIDDVIIYIDILGDKRKPKLVFKSKPMMSKKDIFSYLLFGFAVSESEGAQSSAANAAEKIFGRAVAKDLARELKLDRLDLTRNQLGGINIKAGKKVNRKTIIYYQNRDAQSSAIVERKLSRHLDLDVEIGQGSQAVDLLFRKGFK